MNDINLDSANRNALKLFNETRGLLEKSSVPKLRALAAQVPTSFVDEDKKISIVFAGQYSAGKSSILSVLTGKTLKTGQGVTTDKCTTIDWNGIEVIDTPGIHTQKRPDHDEITYKAMSEADLIVFVCTAEGFSDNLGKHFRKLLIEKGRGNEMMLVFNKMEDCEFGNTDEGRRILYESDVKPVIEPFTEKDLYISYIDTLTYKDALDEKDPEEKELLMKISGYKDLYEQLNKFIEDKHLMGKCTTSLYKLEQLLNDALAEFKSGDFCADGSIELLNQQRKMLSEARTDIKNDAYNIVRKKTQQVREWGNEIAGQLTSSNSQEEVNRKLKEKYDATDKVYQKAASEIEEIIQLKNQELQQKVQQLESSEFAQTLRASIEKKVGEIKMSDKTAKRLQNGSEKAQSAGVWLSKFATGPNAGSGWSSIFKLETYSGSNAHKVVLNVGHFFGHKFKPWGAVKIASKIGIFGKILGAGGAILGVALQIWNDKQEKECEKQLREYRDDIRNTFNEAANVIDLQFDEDTATWISETYTPRISEIDSQIKEIESSVQYHEMEYETYLNLLNQTRSLISEIQSNSDVCN